MASQEFEFVHITAKAGLIHPVEITINLNWFIYSEFRWRKTLTALQLIDIIKWVRTPSIYSKVIMNFL